MKQLVQAVFGLRKGERGLSLLMFSYLYLLLITLYLLKPVRDSLFLSELGSIRLPFVFILVTLVVIPTSTFYARISRRLRLGRLINGVSLFLVLNLLVLYALVVADVAWVYYMLYVWVSIYGVLVTSQFWLLANAIFDAAQSKRIFPMLGLGAILGAATGGEVTNLLTRQIGMPTSGLLLIAGGLLVSTIGLVNMIRLKYYRSLGRADATEAAPDRMGSGTGIWKTLQGSSHLRLIVGLIALTVITTTLIDYQFKTVAAEAFPREDSLTAFMGRFYGRVSLIAFVLQIIFGSQLIQRIGVGGSILALPIILVGASVGMLVAPGLAAAVVLRGADQSLKHSIDKTGRELLFVPMPMEAKKRVKVFVDLFVDQGGQGVAGALLVFFTLVLGFGMLGISVVVLAFLGVWIGLAVVTRNSYIDRFRQILHQQTEESEDPQHKVPTTIEDFQELLNRRSQRRILMSLDEYEEVDYDVSKSELESLMEHESPEVRRRTLQVLRLQGAEGLVDPVAPHLRDEDPDVRLAAARYIYQHMEMEEHRRPLLEQGLSHSDFRIRAAALDLIAREGGPEGRTLVSERLLRQLVEYEGEAAEEVRVPVARVLGVLEGSTYMDMLRQLLNDASPLVVRQAIKSAGHTQKRMFVPLLLERLQQEPFKEEAREALSAYGDRILGTFYDYLNDESIEQRLRRRLPNILAMRPSQASVDLLLSSLERVTVPVRYKVTKALGKMRSSDKSLRFNGEAVREAVKREVQRYGALGQVLYVRANAKDPAAAEFPEDVLIQERKDSLECIFRLLGLRHEQRDLFHAYLGLTGADRSLRAGAVEFLDNLLKWDVKRTLIPLLDDPTGEQAAQKGSEFFDHNISTWSQALVYLLREKHPELNIHALRHAQLSSSPQVIEQVRAAQSDPNMHVQKVAREVLQEEKRGTRNE